MKPIFVPDAIPADGPTIFLAGPTPRNPDICPTWRKRALELLAGFEGNVIIPETKDWGWHGDWDFQVEWEEEGLRVADVIVFWVPRDLTVHTAVAVDESADAAIGFGGFTTNIEFGRWMDSGKVVFGAPKGAPKTGYMRYYCRKLAIPMSERLDVVLQGATALVERSCS
tara:strand:- start:4195 stop:4701 length:507 start_codon:yes stop_codon:yes gene_type:complete